MSESISIKISLDLCALEAVDYSEVYGETEEGDHMYYVVYHVIGKDHDGYCSGCEASDCEEKHSFVSMMRRSSEDDLDANRDAWNEFDFRINGCTSAGGSLWCRGFGSDYEAVYVSKIPRSE